MTADEESRWSALVAIADGDLAGEEALAALNDIQQALLDPATDQGFTRLDAVPGVTAGELVSAITKVLRAEDKSLRAPAAVIYASLLKQPDAAVSA
jgi:hypothetical protein